MGPALRPDGHLDRVTDATPAFLAERGIRAVVLDLDNTLARWRHPTPAAGVLAWLEELRHAGIPVVVLSNGSADRAEAFGAAVGLRVIGQAHKPRRAAFQHALAVLGTAPQETAMLGDQLLTDVWGARRAGLRAFLVRPIDRREALVSRLGRLPEAILLRGHDPDASAGGRTAP